MPFFDLSEQEKRSFLCVVRHTVLEGPLKLVRFVDSSRGADGAYGRVDEKTGLHCSYWMYGSEVDEVLKASVCTGPYGREVIREVARRWAICDDWGDLGTIWTMQVPGGQSLNAYFGFAKFQPIISQKKQKDTGRSTNGSYPGGAVQLVTRIGPMEKTWITGPVKVAELSA